MLILCPFGVAAVYSSIMLYLPMFAHILATRFTAQRRTGTHSRRLV
jgi:hypothetical protein